MAKQRRLVGAHRPLLYLPPGVNLGPPDGAYYDLACSSDFTIDLGTPRLINSLVFYEGWLPDISGCGGAVVDGICLDWIYIDVDDGGGGWINVFYWGDGNSGNNGDIPASHYSTENDNEPIPNGELPAGWGIGIIVGGSRRYIRVGAPVGCGGPAQIDAIQILP